MNKTFSYLIIFLFISLINKSCSLKNSGFNEGFIITVNDVKYKGYVKIDTCEGSYVHFKSTQNDTGRLFPFAKIKATATTNDSFIVIKKKAAKDITLRYYNYKKDIIVKVIEDGALCLFTHCLVDYQSSMFETEKYITYCYIISKRGDKDYYRIPFEPDEFLQVANIYFSDYTELMAEIKTTDYRQDIVHAETGEKFKYASVGSKKILKYVQMYNQWAANLN